MTILAAVLLGLLAVIVAGAVITVAILGGKWVKEQIDKRKKETKAHDPAFVIAEADAIIDEDFRKEVEESDEVSMEDLERRCKQTPYVMATYDRETQQCSEYTWIKPEKINQGFKDRLKQDGGIAVFEG